LEHLSDRLESVPVAVKLACFVAFLEVAIRFVFECFEGLIHAQKAFVPLAMLRNLCSVLRVVLIYFLLLDGASILMLSIIICLLTLAQSAAMAMIALRQKPFVRPRLSLIDLAKIKETFSFSSFVMLTQLAGRFAAATAPVIVGTKLGLAAVVPFSAAASLINYLSSIIVNVSRTLLPYVSTEEYSEDLAKMSRVYTDVSRLSSGIILPAIAGLLVMGEYLLGQWLGDEVGKDTFGVLSVLVVGQALHLVQRGSAYPSLTARGDVSGVALVYVISALVGTGLAFGGAEPYGLRGVALGVAAGSFLSGAGLMTLAFYRFRPHWFGYLVDGYGRGICLAVIVFAVGRLAQQLFVEHPNMNLVLQLLLCGSAALLGIYGVILKPAERGVVNAFLNSNLKKRVS
ncbi:MAG: oligosaccharide flippase family protein, partial [Pseudomonadota bacterium]